MYKWKIGDVELTRVLEFEGPFELPALLHPGATPEIIDKHRSWLEPKILDPKTGRLYFTFHSVIIKTNKSIILVDTCSGNDKPRPHKTRYNQNHWPYLQNLAAAGFTPEDIGYVVCTHLHADHVGWNTRLIDGRWVPTFPNARYVFARTEWEHWSQKELRDKYSTDPFYQDSILPVIEAGQVELVDMDFAFDDEVWLEPSPGHTPGHVCIHIRSQGNSAVLSGDIMHTALQCAEPQLNSCFCDDGPHAQITRKNFLERYVDTPVMVIPGHFPTPTAGWIRSIGSAFRFHFDQLERD
ncbi:MAG: MBL fold metallo-hydrolase [Pseudolabrys sp.]|nr:MBL fold metallo-hydrolase [Pseudolabrys sp.]